MNCRAKLHKGEPMIYQKQSYVAGNMCDGKLQMSVIAADELVENAVT